MKLAARYACFGSRNGRGAPFALCRLRADSVEKVSSCDAGRWVIQSC
jgi:hypothetical protein